jgi:hypothetical protein
VYCYIFLNQANSNNRQGKKETRRKQGRVEYQEDKNSLINIIIIISEKNRRRGKINSVQLDIILRVVCKAVLQHCRWVVESFGMAQVLSLGSLSITGVG